MLGASFPSRTGLKWFPLLPKPAALPLTSTERSTTCFWWAQRREKSTRWGSAAPMPASYRATRPVILNRPYSDGSGGSSVTEGFLGKENALLSFLKNVFIFNWRIIALQYCIGFCQTSTWINHRYTYDWVFLYSLPVLFLALILYVWHLHLGIISMMVF